MTGPANSPSPVRRPLKQLHSDAAMETGVGKIGLESVRRMKTWEIVESLRPSSRAPLKVKPQGEFDVIMDGNTRVKVLRERGYDVDSLPRVPYDQ